jgi:hypothetical protein
MFKRTLLTLTAAVFLCGALFISCDTGTTPPTDGKTQAEALSDVADAATPAAMQTALEEGASLLGISLTTYNSLNSEQKLAVASAVIAGKPYADAAAVITAFDQAVSAQDDTLIEEPGVKVVILQVHGTGPADDGNVSHSFVELFNYGDETVSLAGWALYYRSDIDTTEKSDGWDKLELSGSIPAKRSFLVLGKKSGTASPNLLFDDNDVGNADQIWTDKVFSNRGFSILLRSESTGIPSDVENPFTEELSGYVDLVGVYNDTKDPAKDQGFITAYEGDAALGDITKQKSARRIGPLDAIDTDDNSVDFKAISYRPETDKDHTISNNQRDYYKPHNSNQAWANDNPFAPPEYVDPPGPPPAPLSDGLLIFQVYGDGDATDGAVSHSFIELYNNKDTQVNLSTYSVQYGNAAGTAWTKINLTGTVPSKASYFIRGKINSTGARLNLSTLEPDATFDGFISNKNFKVILVSNQNLITVANPLNKGDETAIDGYVDMMGALNGGTIDAWEGGVAAPDIISKQKSARRVSLEDTNDNTVDFDTIDYRATGVNADNLLKVQPRNTAAGSYAPQFLE